MNIQFYPVRHQAAVKARFGESAKTPQLSAQARQFLPRLLQQLPAMFALPITFTPPGSEPVSVVLHKRESPSGISAISLFSAGKSIPGLHNSSFSVTVNFQDGQVTDQNPLTVLAAAPEEDAPYYRLTEQVMAAIQQSGLPNLVDPDQLPNTSGRDAKYPAIDDFAPLKALVAKASQALPGQEVSHLAFNPPYPIRAIKTGQNSMLINLGRVNPITDVLLAVKDNQITSAAFSSYDMLAYLPECAFRPVSPDELQRMLKDL